MCAQSCLLWCPFKSNPSGRLMADRASGAAWRRRQRRLRLWWRHEQQTVAAALATVTHHSHSKVGTANDAPRGQETVTTPGESGQRHCLSRCRAGSCSGMQASGTKSSRVSMFLCCRWWNSCPTSLSSLPRICRWLSSPSSKCRSSSSRTSHREPRFASRSWRNSCWKC